MIKYKASSGNEYDLYAQEMRVSEGNFHKYSWKPSSEKEKIGEKLKEFTKEAQNYKIVLQFRGGLEERKSLLDRLRKDFENDVMRKNPGRIYFGEYYIEGYCIESETGVSNIKNTWSQNIINFYCPNPFWRRESHYQFLPENMDSDTRVQVSVVTGDIYLGQPVDNLAAFREFAFDFRRKSDRKVKYPQFDLPFDFVKNHGRKTLNNTEAFSESDFILTIYGFADSPSILIEGHPYTINAMIYEGERVIIDSAAGTVKKIGRLGEETNLYNARGKEYSVFQKIPPGVQTVNWSGGFGFDITLFDERSEPKWSL